MRFIRLLLVLALLLFRNCKMSHSRKLTLFLLKLESVWKKKQDFLLTSNFLKMLAVKKFLRPLSAFL